MKNTTHLLWNTHLIRNHNNLYPAWPFRCAVIVCINIWIPIINSEYILSEGRKRFIEKKFSLRAGQPGKTNFIEAILKVPQNLIIQSIQQLQLSSESNYYSTQWRCNRYIIVTWRRSFTEKLVKIWSAALMLYVDMELTETFDLGDKTTFFDLEPSLPPGPTSNLRSKRIALFNKMKKSHIFCYHWVSQTDFLVLALRHRLHICSNTINFHSSDPESKPWHSHCEQVCLPCCQTCHVSNRSFIFCLF